MSKFYAITLSLGIPIIHKVEWVLSAETSIQYR